MPFSIFRVCFAENNVFSYHYDAFGSLKLERGQYDSQFRFSTKEYDNNSGLFYFSFRYYSPNLGRWISRDPIGFYGGINLYSFCRNNPMNFVDPNGIDPYGEAELLKAMTDYSMSHGKKYGHQVGASANAFGSGISADCPTIYYIHAGPGPLCPAYQLGNDVYVDPSFHPNMSTDSGCGKDPASTTSILAHELGHLTGTKDDGPNQMNNINIWENPIMFPIEGYNRTKY